MNEYSENYEKEISLVELLFYCLKNWRWIVLSMVVVAVLAGGYKYQSVVRSNQSRVDQQELMEKYGITEPVDFIKNPSVSYYEQAIASSEQELAKQEAYLRDSVIMQLDANHLQTGTLSFYLDGVEDESIRDSLIAAYRAYVTDGRLADELLKIDDSIPVTDLQYLLSFKNGTIDKDTERVSSVGAGGASLRVEDTFASVKQNNVFQIQIAALDEKVCGVYLEAVEKAVMEYGADLKQETAEHELKVLASVQTEKADEEIRQYQLSTLFFYETVLNNLKTLKTDMKTLKTEEGDVISFAMADPTSSAVKFLIVGLVLGAFLAGFVLILIYLMSGKLRSTEMFQEEYGMYLIGDVKAPVQKKRLFGFIDTWFYRLAQGAYANIPREEQMRIAVASFKGAVERTIQKEGLKKIMLAGTIAKKDVAEFCACLKEHVEEIEYSSYKQIVFDAEALEEVEAYDAIVFLEKKGISYSKLIKKEKELAYSKNAQVLGAVIL